MVHEPSNGDRNSRRWVLVPLASGRTICLLTKTAFNIQNFNVEKQEFYPIFSMCSNCGQSVTRNCKIAKRVISHKLRLHISLFFLDFSELYELHGILATAELTFVKYLYRSLKRQYHKINADFNSKVKIDSIICFIFSVLCFCSPRCHSVHREETQQNQQNQQNKTNLKP